MTEPHAPDGAPQEPRPDAAPTIPEEPTERAVASKTPAHQSPEVGPAAAPEAKKVETAVTSKPAPKPAPAKPAAAKPAAKKGADRRFFLMSWIGVAWTTFTLTMVGFTLGTVRFLFPNVLSEPPSSFKAGNISGYEENVVADRFKDQGVWVIRSRQGDAQGRDVIYALSTTCTHLGCTPNWLESEKKFKCPCHGSGFKISGINFEGPAPRPLERHAVIRTEDGQVLVDKSRKFQRERGEWDNPASYILL
jgi:cytochrome b6-f complex iron-sulfur subunit